MISKCANPDCGTGFHYLRGGRLYRFDLREPQEPCQDVPNAICASKPSQASVYFWLCEECSRQYTVRFSTREGSWVVPLGHPPEGAGAVVSRVPEAG